VLHVRNDGVRLNRKDPQMTYLTTPLPFIEAGSVCQLFPGVMASFARFNIYLNSGISMRAHAREVDVHLHSLEEVPHKVDYLDCMVPGRQFAVHEQEVVLPDDPHRLYGLTLENHSNQPLFPHIVYFDPATYEIDHFYSPIDPHTPPLQPGGQLQLGRSEVSMTALSFWVPSGVVKDIGFLKVSTCTLRC
jgi:hypothetical protein